MSWFGFTALLHAAVLAFAVGVLRAGRPGRGPVPPYGTLTLDEAAYLAGGPGRFADVALLAADRRGAIALGDHVRVPGAGDPVGDALRARGGTLPLAEARGALAASSLAEATRRRLAARGLLTQPRRPRPLPVAQVLLGVVPLLLIVAGPPGSVGEDTGRWFAGMALWLAGAAACGGMAYVLTTHFARIDAPLADHVPGLLWRTARDAAELHRLGTTLPGGDGLGPVAVIGPDRLPEAGLAVMLRDASRTGAGAARANGWSEDDWRRAASARGPLGAPTYLESRPPVPPAPPRTEHARHSGGSAPWETAPGAEPYEGPADQV